MRADLVNQIRGLLKPFGLRPGKLHGAKLAARVRELVADRGPLEDDPALPAAACLLAAVESGALDGGSGSPSGSAASGR
jgi:transposase